MIRKRYVTLIELLLVICILTLATGVIGVQITRLLREERFYAEARFVVDRLSLANQLMLIGSHDMEVTFAVAPDGIELALSSRSPLSEEVAQLLPKPAILSVIRQVHFESDEGEWNHKLCFLSNGSVVSRGVLRLESGRGETGYILLTGSVAPIHYSSERPSEPHSESNLQELVSMTLGGLGEG